MRVICPTLGFTLALTDLLNSRGYDASWMGRDDGAFVVATNASYNACVWTYAHIDLIPW